ncbi:hypothetical protein G7Y89_g1627 [Cudoniella acicularis]|uniref:Uncharacterized protein n=1 Tax=Cudoniella acicularis TaxID=354080 RepID=A0A8H4W7R2_9HELO|nr:hypothetical protein G7Y89_g1627 [Cudoniella acicularis]
MNAELEALSKEQFRKAITAGKFIADQRSKELSALQERLTEEKKSCQLSELKTRLSEAQTKTENHSREALSLQKQLAAAKTSTQEIETQLAQK